MQKTRTRRLVLCAMMTTVTVICAQIAIPSPFSPVFFTLATFAAVASGGILGAKNGAVAQICYIAVGLLGVPVFGAFKGGFGVFAGPTGGYLAAYPLIAFFAGLGVQKFQSRFWGTFARSMAGMICCYALGTLWYCFVSGIGMWEALVSAVIPFIPIDMIKTAAAGTVAEGLEKRKVIREIKSKGL